MLLYATTTAAAAADWTRKARILGLSPSACSSTGSLPKACPPRTPPPPSWKGQLGRRIQEDEEREPAGAQEEEEEKERRGC